MAFLDALRRKFQQTPGFAGGSLEDEMARIQADQDRQSQEGMQRLGVGGGGGRNAALSQNEPLSEEEFNRQQQEEFKAGRPVWTTHASGYGTPAGQQIISVPQQSSNGQASVSPFVRRFQQQQAMSNPKQLAPSDEWGAGRPSGQDSLVWDMMHGSADGAPGGSDQNSPQRQRLNPTLPQPTAVDAVDPNMPQSQGRATTPLGDAPPPPVWNPLTTKPSGEPEISKTAKGPPLDIQEKYYNALQGWQPTGAKRGFKNSLKAGALMAAQAIQQNPHDPVTAAIAGFGLGAAGATAAPNFKNRLTRQWKLGQAGQGLQNQLGIEKQKQQIAQGGMVPFQLPDGTWTQIPAKVAATTASRQQNQVANTSLRKRQMDAHIERWQTMGKHEAARDAQNLYNSGAADDNEDLRDEIAKRMGLPEGTSLPPHTQGRVETDANGNFVLVNPKTGVTKGATQQTPSGETVPVGSMAGTLEKGRNARNAANIASRVGRGAQGGMKPAEWSKATKLVADYNKTRELLSKYETLPYQSFRKQKSKAALAAEAQGLWNQMFGNPHYEGLFETEGNDPTAPVRIKAGAGVQQAQPSAQPASTRTLDGAIKAFKARAKRDPTPAEIENIKQHYGFQ